MIYCFWYVKLKLDSIEYFRWLPSMPVRRQRILRDRNLCVLWWKVRQRKCPLCVMRREVDGFSGPTMVSFFYESADSDCNSCWDNSKYRWSPSYTVYTKAVSTSATFKQEKMNLSEEIFIWVKNISFCKGAYSYIPNKWVYLFNKFELFHHSLLKACATLIKGMGYGQSSPFSWTTLLTLHCRNGICTCFRADSELIT